MLLFSSVVLALTITLATYFWIKTARLRHMAKQFGGPKAYPVIGNLLDLGSLTSTTREIFHHCVQKAASHTSLNRLWVGPWLVIFTGFPKHIEPVLNSVKTLRKALPYNFLHSWLRTGLLTSTGEKWHRRRKILTPAFHFKILDDFMDVFNKNADVLVGLLKKEHNGPAFDIYKYITLCTLDIICEAAMGFEVNSQLNSETEYVRSIKDVSRSTMLRVMKPWLQFDFIFNLSKYGHMQKKALLVLHNTTENIIASRKEKRKEKLNKTTVNTEEDCIGIKQRLAFLDLLIEASNDGQTLSDLDIREEVDTFMFEGHDTTASAVSYTLGCLAANPDVQQKAVEELDSIFGDSKQLATTHDLQNMEYLERVIKESLRLFPPVPLIGRVLDEDFEIEGKIIPAGANIAIPIILIHRYPEFWPDPEKFDPDRFLPESVLQRSPYHYIPFSAGLRNCIGQRFAMMELKTIVSTILRKYKLLGGNTMDMYYDSTVELVLKPESGINIQIVERKI